MLVTHRKFLAPTRKPLCLEVEARVDLRGDQSDGQLRQEARVPDKVDDRNSLEDVLAHQLVEADSDPEKAEH